jgi:hypothetical protein
MDIFRAIYTPQLEGSISVVRHWTRTKRNHNFWHRSKIPIADTITFSCRSNNAKICNSCRFRRSDLDVSWHLFGTSSALKVASTAAAEK